MAILKFTSPSDRILGSRSGTVFSQNRSAFFIRSSAMPTFRRTNRRYRSESSLSVVRGRWRDVLSQPQRDAWNTLGSSTTFTNPLGDNYNPSGYNLYVRTNGLRDQFGFSPIDTAPPSAVATAFNIQLLFYDQAESLTATASQSTPNSYLVFFDISVPLRSSVYYFRGPYSFNSNFIGSGIKNSREIVPAGTFQTGDLISVRSRQMASDGSLSEPVFSLFRCEEDQMFVYQASRDSGTLSVGVPEISLRVGNVNIVPFPAATGIMSTLPIACRIRNLAIHIRILALVAGPPDITISIWKNGVFLRSWVFVTPQVAFTTYYAAESGFSDMVFAADDEYGFTISLAAVGAQTASFQNILFESYFEPGDFS